MDKNDDKKSGIKFGISQKLSVLILSITVIPLLLLGISNYVNNVKTLRADSEKLLTQTASGMAGQANEWIDKNLRALILVSKQNGIVSMKKEEQEKILKSFQNEFPWTYLVFTADRNGINIARTDGGNLQGYSERGYFKEVMAGKPFHEKDIIAFITVEIFLGLVHKWLCFLPIN